ncbi:MAG TPA: hypothetical protein VFP60_07855 [Pseudolabrys sp.]|nr:hypothetical protein [Pseudolabrys sp.]
MRRLLSTAITYALFTAPIAYSAGAQNLPWCAIMDNDGTTQCNYDSQQQSRASAANAFAILPEAH